MEEPSQEIVSGFTEYRFTGLQNNKYCQEKEAKGQDTSEMGSIIVEIEKQNHCSLPWITEWSYLKVKIIGLEE